MREAALLGAALLACTLGMGWLAMAMEMHWSQVRPGEPRPRVALLRALGAAGLAAGLLLCLAADHASMAFLVWIMSLAGAALVVALLLTWRPHWLRLLARAAG